MSGLKPVDISALEENTRLHVLADMLGVTSKQIIGVFDDLGVHRAVRSYLSKEDVQTAIDVLNARGIEAQPEKPKRGPGRPRKVAEPAAEDKPKRGPGRPRKVAEPAAEDKPKRGPGRPRKVAEPAAEDKPKRGPGRPRKVAEPAAEDKPKRGPGRPRKVAEPAAEDKPKRGPGRPRKVAEPAAEDKPKRGPGRPRKVAEPAAEDKPKRGPGRPRKVAEPAAEDKPKRGPGRPRKVVQPAEEQPAKVEFTEEEKLAYRVHKGVENEISQIEQKVELQLAAQAGEPESEAVLRHRVESNVDNEIRQIEAKVEAELALRADAEAEEEPVVTAAPVVDQAMPLFIQPSLEEPEEVLSFDDPVEEPESEPRGKRRRGSRGTSRGKGSVEKLDEVDLDSLISEPVGVKGSTRLEAQRRRREELREESRRKRHVVSEAEFLARRESVERTMVVREREREDGVGSVTQVGVLEDGMLVEHFVTSDAQASMVGNIYLGRVQNVLSSMEAAFIDIAKGRNGVLYAGEVDWRAAGLGGRHRRIEQAMSSGDQVLVQVAKDPVGHKGARLTTQISLAGRYLVYVPGGRSAGISRKLPEQERKRLKKILSQVVPEDGGVIIRTAAEGVSKEAIEADVQRLHTLWEQIQARTVKEKESKSSKPVTLYEEPNLLVKVVRDLFNEDFTSLVVDGKRAWNTVHAYIQSVAPELLDRLVRFDKEEHDGRDAFEVYRVNEQLQKALSRKVWLPSGGTLVIDRTEAMTVIDVNTGKFTGAGGNLEETVTKNNLEAAEEIVRQMRLRDLGGMIVVDFIDMVLPENQDLVLRRLTEALGRDRTRHQISEVTSLGLVQMTRKRLGTGLIETFATECECCEGRGLIIHDEPVETSNGPRGGGHGVPHQDPKEHPAVKAMKSIEELADSLVIAPEEEEEEQVEEPRGRGRRRSRGRRGRGGDTAAAPAPVAEEAEVPSADEAQAPAPVAPEEQSFEEAVAAFERSPRRRRRTRGNSVSDFPPAREDYDVVTTRSQPVAEPASGEPSTSGRRRRRSVRRVMRKS